MVSKRPILRDSHASGPNSNALLSSNVISSYYACNLALANIYNSSGMPKTSSLTAPPVCEVDTSTGTSVFCASNYLINSVPYMVSSCSSTLANEYENTQAVTASSTVNSNSRAEPHIFIRCDSFEGYVSFWLDH
ncbi:hypothetical protein H072_11545 [Dactylellina haptotyla CBS 200.50]|uniref:Uncharacterized protein n=1 Tax=Dactylellina haptotyla (strain CBS 200.50) TaxID=1284197 RepID=S8BIJ5_DACHA|nr:hypothetical protein H072_11545 [Dactylellina haptotyla CBS 200.50]